MSKNVQEGLEHSCWKVRNEAVKALARARAPENAAQLVAVLEDRRRGPWLKRLLGEPRRQVGFIRRNAWKGLENQAVPRACLEILLLEGVTDSYFEVRSQAWLTLKAQIERENFRPDPAGVARLLAVLRRERNFEVLTNALQTLPHLVENGALEELAPRMVGHSIWKVREAFVNCLARCLEMGRIQHEAAARLAKLLQPYGDGFRPVFLLQDRLRALRQVIEQRA